MYIVNKTPFSVELTMLFFNIFVIIFIITIMTYFIDNWKILTKNIYFIFQVSERFYMLISSGKPSGKFTEM